jgi:hypothetical protein
MELSIPVVASNPLAAGGGFVVNSRRTAGGLRWRTLALVAATTLAATLSSAGEAAASECPERPPLAQEIRETDAIFAGQVVEVTAVGDEPPEIWWHARIEVSEVWKGEIHEVVEVRTSAKLWGYVFRESREELVFASSDDEGRLATRVDPHRCECTTRVSLAGEVLAALGDGQEPLPGERPIVRRPEWIRPVAAAGVGATALGIAVWAVLRARRSDAGDRRP